MTSGATLIIVSGLPAAGKSTIARQLGLSLGLRVIDKDDILEGLFVPCEEVDPAKRSRLSRRGDGLLRQQVEASPHAVVTSHWQRAELSTISGTPTDWLRQFPDLVEVHCVCEPASAASRFLQRKRHPFHGDHLKNPAETLRQFEDLDRLGPLGIGHLVTVHTEAPVDIELLASRIERASPPRVDPP